MRSILQVIKDDRRVSDNNTEAGVNMRIEELTKEISAMEKCMHEPSETVTDWDLLFAQPDHDVAQQADKNLANELSNRYLPKTDNGNVMKSLSDWRLLPITYCS